MKTDVIVHYKDKLVEVYNNASNINDLHLFMNKLVHKANSGWKVQILQTKDLPVPKVRIGESWKLLPDPLALNRVWMINESGNLIHVDINNYQEIVYYEVEF